MGHVTINLVRFTLPTERGISLSVFPGADAKTAEAFATFGRDVSVP